MTRQKIPKLLLIRARIGWLDEINHPKQMLEVTGQNKVAV